jgi:small subunit ribosomal protein S8
MSLNDLMSDFVARINNAIIAENSQVEVLKNRSVLSVVKKLVKLGYFSSFKELDRTLVIDINKNNIFSIKRYSKPGHRQYFSYKKLPKIINGVGFNIFTTSKGIKTNVELKKDLVGGELLFTVY